MTYAHVSVMSHKSLLYFGTVEMNIRYGAAPNQDVSVQAYRKCMPIHLRRMNLLVALKVFTNISSPKGGTYIHPGGQRQRLAMARGSGANQIYLYSMIVFFWLSTAPQSVPFAPVLHEELQRTPPRSSL